MLATRISFMNEVAQVCEQYGANVDEVRRAVASDKRIGAAFLFPGCGYGGSCFPKDVKAILKFSKDKGYTFKILEAVEQVNAAQKQLLVDQDAAPLRLAEGQDHRACGAWRSSRAPTTCARRRRSRSSARCSSRAPRSRPTIRRRPTSAKKHFGAQITYARKSYEALVGADALALVTEWNEFREPDFARMSKLMKAPVVFDGRNIYNPQQMKAHGFTYFSIGR